MFRSFLTLVALIAIISQTIADENLTLKEQPSNSWIKRTPLAETPVSPRLGYEGACIWDAKHQLLVRYGGHNQGGGGEQGAEVWTFDLQTARWNLKEPNTSPPGVCCNQQNVYEPNLGRYLRFPKFSGNHGWQWARELYLNDSSVWTYDLDTNRWLNRRPLPAPHLAGLRAASWDSDRQVAVVFGGEGSNEGTLIYDPWRNEWKFPKPKPEPEFRSGGNLAYDAARKLHVLFGTQFNDDRHTWAYDVEKNTWKDMQPAVMPPTDKNDAVLTYDPVNEVVLALIKQTTGKDDDAEHEIQTWAYDAGQNQWTHKKPPHEPDAAGNRTRCLLFAPELNLAILENCTSKPREQQIWTYRFAATDKKYEAPVAPTRDSLPIVENVVVSVLDRKKVEIKWQSPAGGKTVGYHVERAVVEVWSDDQLKRLKEKTPPLEIPTVGAIRRVGPFETLTKEEIPNISFDDETFSFNDETIDLRAPLVINGEPIYEQNLHDEHLDRDGRAYGFAVYAYRVRAVDAAGKTSGPSPACFTIPSSPEHVFSQESGTTCKLKWQANPETKIVGYRVYRLNGQYDKNLVTRLNDVPLAATEFADETAGEDSKRYYIVAVDALGQEGFPSSPVWFNRQWKDYYKPFVGEWHQ